MQSRRLILGDLTSPFVFSPGQTPGSPNSRSLLFVKVKLCFQFARRSVERLKPTFLYHAPI